ncbi:hypothetical protein BC940DRAFT_292913 [Gongronella butleri]|nr:hypothetical protein BC940DRAFT_292913 [Gongronella butleri]
MIKSKDPTIRANEISKRAAIYWGKLTNKQKQPYHVLAEHSRLAHQEAFPNYRYRPKPSPKRRYTRRQILD